MDLSSNRFFAPAVPVDVTSLVVKQLLSKATYVKLTGNRLPALFPEQLV